MLGPQVIAHLHDINEVADGSGIDIKDQEMVLHEGVQQAVDVGGPVGQVHQELSEAAQELGPLQQVAAEGAHDGPVGALPQLVCPVSHLLRDAR